MFRNAIIEIFNGIIPMMIIFLVIIISMRIVYLQKKKQKVCFYKEFLLLAFIIYVMALFRAVTFQDISASDINIVPFKEILRYEFGSKAFMKNVIGNMLMFIPYGFFVSYILKEKKPYIPFFLTLLVSITIELTQRGIGRVFDIDDIFLNILGGLLGHMLYLLCIKTNNKLPNSLKKEFIYNIIVAIVILVIILYFIGVFYV